MTPEALSPRALEEAVACALPYGLSWPQIAPALAGLDVAAIDRCMAFRTFEKQGRFQGSESSCIVTIEYPTVEGPVSTLTVFIKETPADQPESAHYALLNSAGVPTPRLLASVDISGREVIVTEFLPTIGIVLRSRAEVAAMLRAVARLNAVPLVVERDDPPPGRPKAEMDRLRREGLAVLASDPRTGVDAERWFRAFEQLRGSVPAMPEALTHGEFSFQQCGWADRAAGRELVIFDLATMGRRARFADLSSVLPAAAEALGVAEAELFETYLATIADLTGVATPVATAMVELVTYRVLNGFSALHWLTHDVYEPRSDELLDVARRLRRDLATLGSVV